jgi:membrane protein required for colicin V production
MAKIHLLPRDIDTTSKMYDFIKPCGPGVINGFGVLIPWFGNMFTQLETFFGSAAAPVK